MRFSKIDLQTMESIQIDIDNWNEPLTIPSFYGLGKTNKNRAISRWKDKVHLWQDEEAVYFSGGTRLFYYIRLIFHDDDYSKMIQWIIKHRNWNQLIELKEIQKREEQLGYRFRCTNSSKAVQDINKIEIIGEAIK